jgi:hypothetical protein
MTTLRPGWDGYTSTDYQHYQIELHRRQLMDEMHRQRQQIEEEMHSDIARKEVDALPLPSVTKKSNKKLLLLEKP